MRDELRFVKGGLWRCEYHPFHRSLMGDLRHCRSSQEQCIMLERMAKQQEIQLGKKLQDTEKANIEKQRCSSLFCAIF